ncbi:hypothetical protein EL26_07970 [Tumebacillus flagellatus]|uniref:Uncharacterized protein n=2 Tax=Tumebacillus flagellatus TaxID=1157490 RepID=A0A074LRU6_9BACL|nr:hypothetical protein EL26_07970 [Tumebacillus flagellatus]
MTSFLQALQQLFFLLRLQPCFRHREEVLLFLVEMIAGEFHLADAVLTGAMLAVFLSSNLFLQALKSPRRRRCRQPAVRAAQIGSVC